MRRIWIKLTRFIILCAIPSLTSCAFVLQIKLLRSSSSSFSGHYFLLANDRTSNKLYTLSLASDGTLSVAQSISVPNIGHYAVGAPKMSWVYTLADNGNDIESYDIASDGSLTQMPSSPTTATNFHEYLAVDPTGRFLYAPQDGTAGTIDAYAIDQSTGALTPISGSAGCGANTYPTLIAFDPQGKYAYVSAQGLDDTTDGICAFSIDQTTGALTALAGSPYLFSGVATGPYDIVVTPDDKYVVTGDTGNTANFCTQCIAGYSSFAIGAGGVPTYLGTLHSSVYPAEMAVDSLDNVYAADANTSKIDIVTLNGSGLPSQVTSSGTDYFGLVLDPTGKFLFAADHSSLNQYQVSSGPGIAALNPSSVSGFSGLLGLGWAFVPN